MKKTIFLLAFLISSFAFSQIKVLKNESLILIGKDNNVELYKKKNKYTVSYQDTSESNLNTFRSFYFHDLNKDVETLYKLISDGFIDPPIAELQLELPNDIIGLNYEKNYGQNTVQFIHYINKSKKYIGKSHFLTKAQIDKIFGKNKLNTKKVANATTIKTRTKPSPGKSSKNNK